MVGQNKLRVGFDRFIDLEWAHSALAIRLSEANPADREVQLAKVLDRSINGFESARKTRNLLSNLWFKQNKIPALEVNLVNFFRESITPKDLLFLQHGRALVVFPFYKEISSILGRLGHLHGQFTRNELIYRVNDKFGDLSSINRSLDRVLQTMLNWRLVANTGNYLELPKQDIYISGGKAWLGLAVLFSSPDQRFLLSDLVKQPELLGFHLRREDFQNTEFVSIERDGGSIEYIQIKTK